MPQHPAQPDPAVTAVAALDDRLRSALYAFVRRARRPVTREEAAEAAGISRKLAAFHLDKLVAVGLLTADVDPSTPRRIGRAPKTYQPVRAAVEVSVPPRAHADLATILSDAVLSQRGAESGADAARRVAAEAGHDAGAGVDRRNAKGRLGLERALGLVSSVLDERGYEPYQAGPSCVRLRNCPFHPIAQRSPELVCGLNRAFLAALLGGLQADPLEAVLAPATDECCVQIGPRRADLG